MSTNYEVPSSLAYFTKMKVGLSSHHLVLETLVFLPLNQLARLVAREYFITNMSVARLVMVLTSV
jgi:hypothetical protein